MASEVLESFHPTVREWFLEEVGEPTPVQLAAWPRIRAGSHCLICAPTGTGKTLTAFLTALDRLIRGEEGRILYVSPLKALNYDIERNLRTPLEALERRFRARGERWREIRVGLRSGDTAQSERRRLVTHPPEILVTTPESLNLMLSSRSGLAGLAGFTLLILDEIHAVLPSKRGTYLMSGVERLVPICGEFQRIALSATVRPMELVGSILGGSIPAPGGEFRPRPVELIAPPGEKRYDLQLLYPGSKSTAEEAAEDQWWSRIVSTLNERIAANRSTLIFANSRRMVEKVARLLNEEGPHPVYAHHGSLSREIRMVVEERLKAGELRAIVATSSLELGIDIGEIDEVILLQTPFSVASAVQRIGRAGHGVGATSRGTFLPLHSRDLLEAAAMVEAILAGEVEEVAPPERPLDVLSQTLISMAVTGALHIDQAFSTLRSVYAYRDLTREELELVVEMLSGKYADTRIRELKARIRFDRASGMIEARKGTAPLLYMSGGVIPDRGYYAMKIAESNTKIGELDEEFVWERSLGDAFPFGNRAWKITGITNNEVLVTPADGTNSVVPFWRAEELSRPFSFSERVALLLEEAETLLCKGRPLRDLFERRCRMEAAAATALEEHLRRQRERTGRSLPHRHHLLLERFSRGGSEVSDLVLHTYWGSAVNRPFALALAAAWERERGVPLEVYANNDALLLTLPVEEEPPLFELFEAGELQRLLRDSLEAGELFGARFRENAQRALLLPRKSFKERMPLWLNRLRAKKLLAATAGREDFPITLETWRECLRREFDLSTLATLLEEVRSGEIAVSSVEMDSPSPFADSIIWRQTNTRMYQDDSQPSGMRTSLSDELIEEILRSPDLRPEIPGELSERFRLKVQRVTPGYAPTESVELISWVEERLYIPSGEWRELLDAIRREGEDPEALLEEAGEAILRVEEFDGVIASSREELVRDALASTGAVGSREDEGDLAPALQRFLAGWLPFYPPRTIEEISALLPVSAQAIETAVSELISQGTLLEDRITEGCTELQLCDRENLEILLRMRRSESRAEVAPLSPGEYQRFLAERQGVARRGEGLEDLERRVEQLFGYPARAELWEQEFLPARLEPYYPSWLDQAMGESDLLWFGCGPGRCSFGFEEELSLFLPAREGDTSTREMEEIVTALEQRGRAPFLELTGQLKSGDAAEALWELVWQGAATNDTIEALRRGVRSGFKAERPGAHATEGHHRAPRRPGRGGFRRWQSSRPIGGSWRLLDYPEATDPLEESERAKERVRILLDRYGIIHRQILQRELPLLQWKALFRTLRLMELSGELITGHFIEEYSGLQFAPPSVAREIGEAREGVYWMNACDPASLCGVDLPGKLYNELPKRLPSTHLVWEGASLVLVSRRRGASLRFYVSPEAPRIEEYLALFRELLSRQSRSLSRIRVEEINGVSPKESPYTAALLRFGFMRDGAQLTLYRSYGL